MAQYQQHPQQYHQPYQQQYQQTYPEDYAHQQPQQSYGMPQQPNSAHTYQTQTGMNAEKAPIHEHDHIQKPTQKGSSSWTFGLFDCFAPIDLCLISCCCPCYQFGKTYERNKTGEKDPSGFNGMCAAHCATLYCGCSPILQCMTRQSFREKHGINGEMFGDFCASCCCACCTLIQEEKESLVRVAGVDPKTGAVYQPVPSMTYP